MVNIKRIYDDPTDKDSVRYLVDRLWPRGISKDAANLEGWLKDIAPSDDLRKWYGHKKNRWGEFRRRYKLELRTEEKQKILNDLAKKARRKTVILLFAAKDIERNNAAVLQEVLQSKLNSMEKE